MVVQLGHMAFLKEILAQYGQIGNFRLSEGLDSPSAEKNTFIHVSSLRSRSARHAGRAGERPPCSPSHTHPSCGRAW